MSHRHTQTLTRVLIKSNNRNFSVETCGMDDWFFDYIAI